MKDLLTGKTVAVVGNAQSLFTQEYGLDIDNHDVVCRINLGAVVDNALTHGTRTDLLIFSKFKFAKKTKAYQESIGGYFTSVLLHAPTDGTEVKTVPVFTYPESWMQLLGERLGLVKGQKPSTGLMLLDYLDHYNTASVDVYGFDWKSTPTFYCPPPEIESHHYQLEKLFCMEYYYAQKGFRFYG